MKAGKLEITKLKQSAVHEFIQQWLVLAKVLQMQPINEKSGVEQASESFSSMIKSSYTGSFMILVGLNISNRQST